MTPRQGTIRTEYQRFRASIRIARWAAIDDALAVDGERPLASAERDEIDMAAAMDRMPFDDDGDIDDLIGGTGCKRCGDG
jgi:hypothetical protein